MAPDGSTARSSLHDRTLVLNRSWIPVHMTTVRRAIVLVFAGSALAVHPETFETFDFDRWSTCAPAVDARTIRTPQRTIQVPTVILLCKYDRLPSWSVPFSRRNLFRRDQQKCQYCGRRQSIDEVTIDHVLPRSKGGATGWLNCVIACVPCNRKKGGMTLEQAGMKLLAAPRRPEWHAISATAFRGGGARPAHDGATSRSSAHWPTELIP
jgi:5-methylcytosine-specific restriction endonuclease McrA